ncbi:hypothetical protein DPMN_139199 [Dreissena polymorpha]|uniref:Uncharacterized protein n=1 Tax=Dreissena polymorpha TaxID=45954 RepID=A0A9D4JFF5_DREPO|nr:hypothetical protein DPMN_139199 [Dreissena polymorpha]
MAPFCASRTAFLTFGILFGLSAGSASSLHCPLVPNLFGVAQIADFSGINMFFSAVAAFTGLPAADRCVHNAPYDAATRSLSYKTDVYTMPHMKLLLVVYPIRPVFTQCPIQRSFSESILKDRCLHNAPYEAVTRGLSYKTGVYTMPHTTLLLGAYPIRPVFTQCPI